MESLTPQIMQSRALSLFPILQDIASYELELRVTESPGLQNLVRSHYFRGSRVKRLVSISTRVLYAFSLGLLGTNTHMQV